MQTKPNLSPLGSTGLEIPSIVFGTSALGNLYQALDENVKREIVAQWFAHSPGIVAADSAGKYGAGLALESMAVALTQLDVDPNDILISNKLGWRRVPLRTSEPTFEPGAWVGLEHDAVQDISYEGILRCWHQGCELLAPYQPQLLSVHDPDEYLASATGEDDRNHRWQQIVAAYEALRELRDRGEVAAIGVGSKDWRVSARLAETCDLDWVMLATSLTVYNHPKELLDFVESLRVRDIAVINSAVFNAGFLTGGDFFDYRKVTGDTDHDKHLLAWRDRFTTICDRFDVKPAQACVAFGASPPAIVSTALNSSRPSRIKENVSLVDAAPPNDFWVALKQARLIESDYPYLGLA